MGRGGQAGMARGSPPVRQPALYSGSPGPLRPCVLLRGLTPRGVPSVLVGHLYPCPGRHQDTPTPTGLVGSQGWEGAGLSTPSGLEPRCPTVPPRITCIPHPHAGDDSFTPDTRRELRPTSLSVQPAFSSHTGSSGVPCAFKGKIVSFPLRNNTVLIQRRCSG